MRASPGGRGERDGDELSKSTPVCGCSGAARTGMDTKLLGMPGSLGQFMSGGCRF